MSPLLLRLAARLSRTDETTAAVAGRTGESVGRHRGRLVAVIRERAARVAVRRIASGHAAAVLTPVAVGLVFAAVALGAILGAIHHPEGTHQ